jgi:hypothetical protein
MQEKENSDINQNHIILWFANYNFPHEEITAKLNLQPTRIASNGQEQATTNGVTKISRYTLWEYEWKTENNAIILWNRRKVRKRNHQPEQSTSKLSVILSTQNLKL